MFSRKLGSWDDELVFGLVEFDVLMEEDELLTNGVHAPELECMNKSDESLMNDVNGDELGLDEDDEAPLMEGVLRDVFVA